MQPTPSIFQHFVQIISCFTASTLMHNYVCLTKQKCSLTHCSPSPTKVCPPYSLSQRAGEPSAATGHFPAEDSGGKCTHQGAQEVATAYSIQLKQVCNMCVCMCEHVSACVCIMYISVVVMAVVNCNYPVMDYLL